MRINEIYLSINGEGFASAGRQAMVGTGVPTVLVRTQSCHIQCAYCDSAFTWDATETGTEFSIPQVLSEIESVSQGYQSVLLTGGEPGIQKDVTEFCHAIKNAGYTLAVETAGGCDIRVFGTRPAPDSIILDIKCPSAGEKAMRTSWVEGNLERLRPADQIKFIIGTSEDWAFMLGILDGAGLAQPGDPNSDEPIVIAAPLFHRNPEVCARDVAEWILNSRRNIMLGVPVHKYVWPPEKRKV